MDLLGFFSYKAPPACILSLEEIVGHKNGQSSKREENHLLFHVVSVTISWCFWASMEMKDFPHYFHKVYLRLDNLTWFLDVITGPNKKDNAS